MDFTYSDDQVALRDLAARVLGNAHGAELASVKAVQAGYPLRGVLRTAPALNAVDAVASGVPAPGEVWLDERLMTSLQARVGDVVEFGQLDLRVAALLTFESDRGGNFISLAPRALVNAADLAASGLLGAGSRARYRIHVAGEAGDVAAFESWARAGLGRGVRRTTGAAGPAAGGNESARCAAGGGRDADPAAFRRRPGARRRILLSARRGYGAGGGQTMRTGMRARRSKSRRSSRMGHQS